MNYQEVENVAKGHAFMYNHICKRGKFTLEVRRRKIETIAVRGGGGKNQGKSETQLLLY